MDRLHVTVLPSCLFANSPIPRNPTSGKGELHTRRPQPRPIQRAASGGSIVLAEPQVKGEVAGKAGVDSQSTSELPGSTTILVVAEVAEIRTDRELGFRNRQGQAIRRPRAMDI